MGSTEVKFNNPSTSILFDLDKNRRTLYNLKAESPVSDSTIEKIVQDAVLHVPSSFNTQTTRIVLLLHQEHQKLWDIALEVLQDLVAAGAFTQEL